MKITRRESYHNPWSNSHIWIIPTLFYLMFKSNNGPATIKPHLEYIWYLLIGGTFLLWFFIGYKIKTK